MIRDSIVIIAVVTVLIMVGSYYERGYFCLGSELIVAPTMAVVFYVIWKAEEERKAKFK